jgi:hypothetical protein
VTGLNLLWRTATISVDIIMKLVLKIIGYEDEEMIQQIQEGLQRWAQNPILNLGVEYNSEKWHST